MAIFAKSKQPSNNQLKRFIASQAGLVGDTEAFYELHHGRGDRPPAPVCLWHVIGALAIEGLFAKFLDVGILARLLGCMDHVD